MKTLFHRLSIMTCLLVLCTKAYAFKIGDLYFSEYGQETCCVSGCNKNATSVIIPSEVTHDGNIYSVTKIDEKAFEKCTSLVSVSIPNSVTSIGKGAFFGCEKLISVSIPNSVTGIGESAFNGCAKLISVNIPNSVTSIGENAFRNCVGLISVTIGSGVQKIGTGAFSCYENYEAYIILRKVIWLPNTPPEGYKEIDGRWNYVSSDSYSNLDLDNCEVYPYLSSMFVVNGIKYVPVNPTERTCEAIDCMYDSTATNINIGKTVEYKGINMTVKNIKPHLCYKNDYVNDVKIDCVGSIGDAAFGECSNLQEIQISNSIDSIGMSAFGGCVKLTDFTIPSSITSIERFAFWGCTSLADVDIPNSVKSIGSSVFTGCTNLANIVIPNSVTSIGDYAFSNSGLSSVDIPNSVTSIGKAFDGCSSLKSVSVGKGIKTIESRAFEDCVSLASFTIPKNVESIGAYAFEGCGSLSEIIIEDRVTDLKLAHNEKYERVDGEYRWMSYPLFNNCPLKSIYIGGNIIYETSYLESYPAFYNNTTLKNVTVGDFTKSISDYAFSGCSSLEKITFGTNLKSIGKEAFSDCTALTRITAKAEVPPTCGTQALDDINKWTCTLCVPEAQMEAYKAADQWKDFFFYDTVEAGVESVNADDAVEVERFNLDGTRLTAPQKGINIVRMSDGTTRKVLVK